MEDRQVQVTPQTLVASPAEASPWDLAGGLNLPRRDDFTRPAPRSDLPIPEEADEPGADEPPSHGPEKEQPRRGQFTYAKAGGESMKVTITRPRPTQPLPEEKED